MSWIGLVRTKCVELTGSATGVGLTPSMPSDLQATSDAGSQLADPSLPENTSSQSDLPLHADLMAFFAMDGGGFRFDMSKAEAFVRQFTTRWPHVVGVNANRIMLIRWALVDSEVVVPHEGLLTFVGVTVKSLHSRYIANAATSAEDVDYDKYRELLNEIVRKAADICHISFPQPPHPRVPITANKDVLPMLRLYQQKFRKLLSRCKAYNEHFEFLFELLDEDNDRPGTYYEPLNRIEEAIDTSTRKAAIMSLLRMMLVGDCHGPEVTQATLEGVINSIDEGLSMYDLSS